MGDGESAPAASLPWEVLAAIDVASVPVCVSLCVPATATGSPWPPALPHTAQGPPWLGLLSGLCPAGSVPPMQQVGCSGLVLPCRSPRGPSAESLVPRDRRRWHSPGVGQGAASQRPTCFSVLSPSSLPQSCPPPLGLVGTDPAARRGAVTAATP